jgi:hypothetical protein
VPTIGLRGDHGSDEIPASHHDPVAALTTVTPDGYPQTSVVWCDFDGVCVRVNTMRGFAKSAICAATRGSHCCATTPASRCATCMGRVTVTVSSMAAADLDRTDGDHGARQSAASTTHHGRCGA